MSRAERLKRAEAVILDLCAMMEQYEFGWIDDEEYEGDDWLAEIGEALSEAHEATQDLASTYLPRDMSRGAEPFKDWSKANGAFALAWLVSDDFRDGWESWPTEAVPQILAALRAVKGA